MLVREALVQSPFVVRPETTLRELIDAILGGNQTTAAVVADGRLLGTVSSVDVLRRLLPSYVAMGTSLVEMLPSGYFVEALEKLRDVRAGDVMSDDPHVLSPDASLMSAIAIFVSEGRKTLPVVENGYYVGSVTRRSVLRIIRDRAVGGDECQ